MEKLIICPNEYKMKLLEEKSLNNSFDSVKYMTKNEYINNYLGNYDDKAIMYLMDKYNLQIDVCRVYLDYLKVIDENKIYNNKKLDYLVKIKKELINNKLYLYNNYFREYIKNKEIVVENYYDLDKYEEKALNNKIEIPEVEFNKDIYEFNSMEEEVNFVCLKIIELLDKGIDINKIYLCNVSSDYYYTIDKIFSYYKIPIEINYNKSIYGTKVVRDYINNGLLDLEDNSKSIINKKLLSVINSMVELDKDSINYNKLLIDKLKHTTFSGVRKKSAVRIKDLYTSYFLEDEYVFVLGFNQDSLPKMEKDIDYLEDKVKKEVDMYDTTYINKRSKLTVLYLLNRINNCIISYKLNSPFQAFYPSSLIAEYGLNVIKDKYLDYTHSNFYNKISLAKMLDLYHLYGEENEYLRVLNTHYDIPYLSYSNEFLGIDYNEYLENLDYPLKLSYTSLNTYNECSFKYYIRNVLKIEEYEDTFASFIGSMYHQILALYRRSNFNFEVEYQKYLEKRELSLKEKLLLIRIKKDLLDLIEVLNKQQYLTGYDNYYAEKKVEVEVESEVSVKFIGYIDKIMFYQNMEDTYFSIIDYKSGTIDTHIEPMKYGLHMQLPVYLYLIHLSRCFTNPIFTGIYYQNILFNYPTWSLKVEDEKKKRYLLNGYSTNDINILERFDTTYEDSLLIKSMKYKDDKFSRYSKVMDNDTLYELIQFTKEHIKDRTKRIVDGDFKINPKVYDGSNVSCNFCSFKDLCYMRNSDLVYLDKVNDLSFLGGEE